MSMTALLVWMIGTAVALIAILAVGTMAAAGMLSRDEPKPAPAPSTKQREMTAPRG